MSAAKQPKSFTITTKLKDISCIICGDSPVDLIFTHGAGGTLASDAMANFTSGFSTTSSIICFQGNMNLKSRVNMFEAVIDDQAKQTRVDGAFALGGRSMGARAAVIAAVEQSQRLVLVSYPLQTDKEIRDRILLELSADKEVLFISGDQDPMCDLGRLNQVRKDMQCKTWLVKVRDTDHGMNVKPKRATRDIGVETGKIAAQWLLKRDETKTECEIWWQESEESQGSVKHSQWTEISLKSTQSKKRLAEDIEHEGKRKTKAESSLERRSKRRKRP